MNLFDAIIILVIGGLAVSGLRRGFSREIVETVGVVAAGFIASRFSVEVARVLGIEASSSWWSKFLLISGVFITCMILFTLLGRLLQRSLRAISLGSLDRLGGLLLGALKGGVVVALLSLAMAWTGGDAEHAVDESRLAQCNLAAFEWLVGELPEHLQFPK